MSNRDRAKAAEWTPDEIAIAQRWHLFQTTITRCDPSVPVTLRIRDALGMCADVDLAFGSILRERTRAEGAEREATTYSAELGQAKAIIQAIEDIVAMHGGRDVCGACAEILQLISEYHRDAAAPPPPTLEVFGREIVIGDNATSTSKERVTLIEDDANATPRCLARTKVCDMGAPVATVSTVALSFDHQHGEGPALLFESMVFGGALDGEMQRYSTRDEAVVGHRALVDRVRACVLA